MLRGLGAASPPDPPSFPHEEDGEPLAPRPSPLAPWAAGHTPAAGLAASFPSLCCGCVLMLFKSPSVPGHMRVHVHTCTRCPQQLEDSWPPAPSAKLWAPLYQSLGPQSQWAPCLGLCCPSPVSDGLWEAWGHLETLTVRCLPAILLQLHTHCERTAVGHLQHLWTQNLHPCGRCW